MTLDPVSTGDPHVAAHNAEREQINDLLADVATRIAKPNNPQVGAMLRFDGTQWLSSATRIYEGDGTPVGKIAAPIGSRYIDLNGTNGAVEWIKARGAENTNTGWDLAHAADTGIRNVANMIDKRGSAVISTAHLRRVGSLVELYISMDMPTNVPETYNLMTLPAGFRPAIGRWGALQADLGNVSNRTNVGSNGVVMIQSALPGRWENYNGFWFTSESWPSTLPGSAA